MFTVNNPFGFFDYTVTGERAKDAAADMENQLEYLSRLPGATVNAEILYDIRHKIESKYNVVVRMDI